MSSKKKLSMLGVAKALLLKDRIAANPAYTAEMLDAEMQAVADEARAVLKQGGKK